MFFKLFHYDAIFSPFPDLRCRPLGRASTAAGGVAGLRRAGRGARGGGLQPADAGGAAAAAPEEGLGVGGWKHVDV